MIKQEEKEQDLKADEFRCALCEKVTSINDMAIVHKEDKIMGIFYQYAICIRCHDKRQTIILNHLMNNHKV